MALPRDVGFEKDDFQKSKIFKEADSLVNYILNILLAKPGNFPTMPKIGVNIGKYVKNSMESLDSELLKGLICSNCEALLPYITNDDVYVGVINDPNVPNRSILLVKIPLMVVGDSEKIDGSVYYAFYRNELNNLKFKFLVDRD